jgi:hypothetical protein
MLRVIYAESPFAECHKLALLLSVVRLNVIMLSVIATGEPLWARV